MHKPKRMSHIGQGIPQENPLKAENGEAVRLSPTIVNKGR